MPRDSLAPKDHLLKKDELRRHATISAASAVRRKLPYLDPWRQGMVAKTPMTIYDLDGTPLFQDFTVARGRSTLGTVRVGASRVLGPAAISYEIGPRHWSYRTQLANLRKTLATKYGTRQIAKVRPVCYSYPKLGLLVDMVDSRNRKHRAIFDIFSLREVPEKAPGENMEGDYAWSYYAALAERERAKRLKRFQDLEGARGATFRRIDTAIAAQRKLAYYDKADLLATMKLNVSKELPFCSHYSSTEERSHHCFVLHAQETWDYCAVATCQMILCYYRYYFSQDDIAPELNYSAGGCPADQSAGYESLTNDHLEATYDTSATWAEARAEIDKLHPMKSGVPAHARAVAGYAYTTWLKGLGISDRQLLVYDPAPWNANLKLGGSVYWEDWDAVTHTNFIYTKLKTT